MKATVYIFLGLLYLTLNSFSCDRCYPRHLRLDSRREWLPLKGKTQLSFSDRDGNTHDFKLAVTDTIETINEDCANPSSIEYIDASIYLNAAQSDSISFILTPTTPLCVTAFSNNELSIRGCNLLKPSQSVISVPGLTLGNRTYREALLLLANYPSRAIDSVYLAKGYGIVGFNYLNERYVLN